MKAYFSKIGKLLDNMASFFTNRFVSIQLRSAPLNPLKEEFLILNSKIFHLNFYWNITHFQNQNYTALFQTALFHGTVLFQTAKLQLIMEHATYLLKKDNWIFSTEDYFYPCIGILYRLNFSRYNCPKLCFNVSIFRIQTSTVQLILRNNEKLIKVI